MDVNGSFSTQKRVILQMDVAGHVAGKGWAGLCVIGDSLRSVVDTTASHVEQRQQCLN